MHITTVYFISLLKKEKRKKEKSQSLIWKDGRQQELSCEWANLSAAWPRLASSGAGFFGAANWTCLQHTRCVDTRRRREKTLLVIWRRKRELEENPPHAASQDDSIHRGIRPGSWIPGDFKSGIHGDPSCKVPTRKVFVLFTLVCAHGIKNQRALRFFCGQNNQEETVGLLTILTLKEKKKKKWPGLKTFLKLLERI